MSLKISKKQKMELQSSILNACQKNKPQAVYICDTDSITDNTIYDKNPYTVILVFDNLSQEEKLRINADVSRALIEQNNIYASVFSKASERFYEWASGSNNTIENRIISEGVKLFAQPEAEEKIMEAANNAVSSPAFIINKYANIANKSMKIANTLSSADNPDFIEACKKTHTAIQYILKAFLVAENIPLWQIPEKGDLNKLYSICKTYDPVLEPMEDICNNANRTWVFCTNYNKLTNEKKQKMLEIMPPVYENMFNYATFFKDIVLSEILARTIGVQPHIEEEYNPELAK